MIIIMIKSKIKNEIEIIILMKKNNIKKYHPPTPLGFFKKKLISITNVEKFCTCSYIPKICLY